MTREDLIEIARERRRAFNASRGNDRTEYVYDDVREHASEILYEFDPSGELGVSLSELSAKMMAS